MKILTLAMLLVVPRPLAGQSVGANIGGVVSDESGALLQKAILPDRPLHPWFLQIVRQGTGKEFTTADNNRWTLVTRPIVEAFFHARFFLEMAVRYAALDGPPRPLPSGYAALLYLYQLR
jgi:hypothetical protein